MKFLYFCLFLLLLINLAIGFKPKLDSEYSTSRSISNQLRKVIVSIRDELKHGFPDYGIPPLAPFERQFEVIDFEHKFLTLYATVSNLTIVGADNFNIVECDYKFWSRKIKLDLMFHSLHVQKGLYELEVLIAEELGIVVRGNGSLDYEIKNLKVNTELQIGIGWKGLKVKNFKTVVDIGSCKSNITGLISDGLTTQIINRVFEELTINIINDHKNDLSQMIYDLVVPYANEFLSKITIMDIIKWIFGKK